MSSKIDYKSALEIAVEALRELRVYDGTERIMCLDSCVDRALKEIGRICEKRSR
jgi:hypothetical protein